MPNFLRRVLRFSLGISKTDTRCTTESINAPGGVLNFLWVPAMQDRMLVGRLG